MNSVTWGTIPSSMQIIAQTTYGTTPRPSKRGVLWITFKLKKFSYFNFLTLQGKDTLQRVFARDDAQFQRPKESRTLEPEEIQNLAIRKQYKFDSEIKQKIMRNPKMGTMQNLLKDNILPNPPDPGSTSLYNAAKV